MYIKSIELENFRCFEKLSLELHPRLNVFLGENGAGKSSVLEALKILLGCIIEKLGKNESVKKNISCMAKNTIYFDDIFNSKNKSTISIVMWDKKKIAWSLTGKKNIEKGNFISETTWNCDNLHLYIANIVNLILQEQETIQLPIFVSYGPKRYSAIWVTQEEDIFEENPTSIVQFSPKDCYDYAMWGCIERNYFLRWFKAREDLENEIKVRAGLHKDTNDRQLSAVRDAIKAFAHFSEFSVDRTSWKFLIKKNNKKIYFNQLSDGEQGYILLVGDIARRLAIANPALDNPLEGAGIILIDEIELHLHPKWQRVIIPQLLKTFPNCQFIVTSHSPQVLGEIEDINSIWILEEGQEPYHPSRAYGMESSELLREVMGAESRAKDVTEALEKIDRLIDDEHFDEARAAIKDLAKKTGKIPDIHGVNACLTMLGQEQVEIED